MVFAATAEEARAEGEKGLEAPALTVRPATEDEIDMLRSDERMNEEWG